jgi:hypothetical protein
MSEDIFQNSNPNRKIKSKRRIRKSFWAVLVIVISFLVWIGYKYYNYTKSDNYILQKVSEHILVPEGAVKVFRITNVESLRNTNSVFFARANNGDVMLNYSSSRQVILYSPKLDKIINIAEIKIDNQPDLQQ